MESKIIGYKVVRAVEVEVLIEKVNALIEQGWEPWGSPYGFEPMLTQAMIRKHQPQVFESGRCIQGEENSIGTMGKRPSPISADPDDFYHR